MSVTVGPIKGTMKIDFVVSSEMVLFIVEIQLVCVKIVVAMMTRSNLGRWE